MNPTDIPTKLMDTAPPAAIPWGGMTRNQCAELLAHFWPAIEQHIRGQIAQELFAEAEKTASEDTDPGAKARRAGLYIGAQIARGNAYSPQATDVEPTGTARDQNNYDAYTL